jgi:hypothetical protein
MKALGLRTPSQSARALCFWMHGTEQVRAPHRGHLYLGGSVWQMLQRVLRTVPDMAALLSSPKLLVVLHDRVRVLLDGIFWIEVHDNAYRNFSVDPLILQCVPGWFEKRDSRNPKPFSTCHLIHFRLLH